MELKEPVVNIFVQLENLLGQISDDDYSSPLQVLNQATIGQHYRHTVEMFTCLLAGVETGTVNYDDRKRDKRLEENKEAVIVCLKQIEKSITRPDKDILLQSDYSQGNSTPIIFKTTYYRELAYALEHAVHHMALIKIGFKAIAPSGLLPDEFGVASSTIQYRRNLQVNN